MRMVVYIWVILLSNAVYGQNLDIRLLKEINLNRNKAMDPAFRTISHTATPLSFIVPIAVTSAGWVAKNNPLAIKGLIIGESILAASILNTGLKYSIGRDRPFVTYPVLDQVVEATSPSLPSGHTSTAFATATSLSLAFPKWYVIAPSYIWAGAVGYSRMHLGVHYPSDVLAGALIGSGSVVLTRKMNKWLNKKNT